ncbi:hypothetical protein W97_02020 [Coniosporium apollinis CBS 100218]|uniref:Uncharacterized protein n=1 Tax=Coniosporium apollinis (strain CBS 100218) TaxID=1168221 RepID=R7YLK9_CONA1|nr:uncharacterized protein W97_02020 [Coniosporium apollinis CBS 100218]EON62795.1 hypothetical protein W97_02020 [Coniosporium apollinis CBS 100218]
MSCRASRERYFDRRTFLIAGGEAVLADRAENHDEKTRATRTAQTAQTAMRTKADRSRGYDAHQDIAIPITIIMIQAALHCACSAVTFNFAGGGSLFHLQSEQPRFSSNSRTPCLHALSQPTFMPS